MWRTGAVVIRVTLTMIGKAAITYSYALIYLYTPEIYPTVIRGAGLGIASMMARIGGVVAPLIADLVSQLLFFHIIPHCLTSFFSCFPSINLFLLLLLTFVLLFYFTIVCSPQMLTDFHNI